MTRADDLAANLSAVRGRIAAARELAGRSQDEVSLTVVTKFFPPSDVRILADLGVSDVGENRHQEAVEKAEECVDLGLRWHFIGGLQSNKAAAVASYADVVESVDRTKLVAPLQRGAQESGRSVDVLLQVSLDDPGAGHRSGADPGDLGPLADAVDQADGLRLRGLMAVAPLPSPGGPTQDQVFARLAEIHAQLLTSHPGATELSAGMSGDLEAAIRHGATRVRVGSAVLGPRPAVK